MTINLNGNLMDLSTPKIMGILNVTPDSFYDGGMFDSNKKILDHVEKMLTDGVDIIDVGGYSSRPGAKEVKLKDEIKRVVPTIELIKKEFNETTISVDTFRSEVALQAVNSGASIINDISGGDLDPNMFNCVAELNVPYIIMHMRGNPKNMQNNPLYENVIVEIIENLSKKVFEATEAGVIDVIIDPGFGFGKTLKHNYELLNNLDQFKQFNYPILVGLSRKSMIYKILDSTPQYAINGTIITNTIALQNGANILRVHDVSEAIECIKITTFAKNNC